MNIADVITNIKVGATVAVTSVSTGVATTWFDLIPDDIGKLASLFGLILSVVLIISHLCKIYIGVKRNRKMRRTKDYEQ